MNKYLVAVKLGSETRIFDFPTKKSRAEFIQKIVLLFPKVSFATSENTALAKRAKK